MKQIPNIEEWKKEFDEKYPPVTIGYDGNETDYFRREWTKELIEKTLHHQLQKARQEEMKKIPDGSVDLVLTDPPFVYQQVRGKNNGMKPEQQKAKKHYGQYYPRKDRRADNLGITYKTWFHYQSKSLAKFYRRRANKKLRQHKGDVNNNGWYKKLAEVWHNVF